MSDRIFVTGASGFVGSAVVDELLARGFDVAALVHRGSIRVGEGKTISRRDAEAQRGEGAEGRVRVHRGDLFAGDVMESGMRDCSAVIHLVGIIRENPKKGLTFERIHHEGAVNVMEAAKRAGVRRFVHMSALGAAADAESGYHRTKFAAEEHLRKSGLDWTTFRPSLIHGPAGEFLKMEAGWARGKAAPFLFMPYFSGGVMGLAPAKRVQPVDVKDVARAFVEAIGNVKAIGKTYALGGRDVLTWPQMHHVAARIFTGKTKAAIAIPYWYALLLTRVVPGLLPFTRDQVLMAREDNTGDIEAFAKDFGWTPGGFEEMLGSYAAKV